MISKNALEESILHECTICKHLHGKFPEGTFDYRPSAAQRSTLELLRYLAMVGVATLKTFQTGDWGGWRSYSERVATMTPEEFPAAMDRQMEEIRELFAEMTEEELATRIVRLPTGREATLGVAIMDSLLKWFTAYKMQLFLYAKANGVDDISTSNCWRGADMPPRESKPEVARETASAQA